LLRRDRPVEQDRRAVLRRDTAVAPIRAAGRSSVAQVEARLAALGLVLPPAPQPPPGIVLPFRFVHVVASRAFVSGHGPQAPDGSFAEPRGKLGRDLTEEQGYAAARLTALSILGSLKRALGDLDRVVAWTRVFGMVNSAPGFHRQPNVINGFSDLILELYGPEAGAHARSAVGMAELPFDIPVEIEGEVLLEAPDELRNGRDV
jgi:enamine deaminase RidA (YjgF/YER057c/UK114 family)